MKTKLFTLLLAVAASVGTMFANQVWPILMDETTFATCNSGSTVVAGFWPNEEDRFLYRWDNTYDNLTTAGPNFMGNTDGYLSLRVGSQGWAGAAFCLTENGNSWQAAEQLRAAIVANPDNYYLHMAIKSTDNYSHCFYLFNTEATKFVLGNHSVYDGPIYSDFTRDGAWHEFYIPMSTYASALASVTCSGETNIFVMLSEGVQGAMLNLDAVYICDEEFMNTAFGNRLVQIGDLYYNLDATNQTAEVTSQNSSYPYWSTIIATANIPSSVTYNSVSYSVTSIGDGAFYGCSGLTSVTIGNSVTSIGSYAFRDCTGLTSMEIPNSVTSIEYGAFSGCSSLTSPVFNAHVFAFMPTSYSGAYTIPDGIESIAVSAFDNCSGLTSVTIPNSVTSIGMEAFAVCSGLTSVTIPNSVTSIGSGAFYGCSGLTSVTIPNSVTSIGDLAFSGCSGLTSVTIPNSVTSIGYSAFYNCTGLTSVTIPNSVTSIGNYAFSSCTGLTSVTIPNSVTSIGNGAFCNCRGLTSIEIPNSVTSIGESAFYGCSGLTSVIWNAKNCADFASNNTPFYANDQYTRFDLRPQITSFTFGNEVEHIPAYLCNGMSNLTSIEIPNSVTSIGSGAFSGCSGLTGELVIPNGVTSIGGSAFSGCSGLTGELVIPNGVTSIGGSAFSGCSGLTGELVIPNGVTSIGNNAFYGCSGLNGELVIPNSVTSIGDRAFYGCSGLTSVTIPNSVTSIGGYAFYECYGLTSVTIPGSVTSIGECAICNCSGLTSMEAPAGFFDVPEDRWTWCTKILNHVTVNGGELTENALLLINRSYKTLQTLDVSGVTNTEFADEAFKGYYNLQQLVLPEGLQKVGYMMVAGCKNLQSINIPASVEEIEQSAFEDCRSIQSITFGGSSAGAPGRFNAPAASASQLRRIGNWAFYNAHELQNLEIPEGVTEIGDGAFYGCTYLEEMVLPSSVQSIGDNCFALCAKLTKITCNAVTPPTIQAKTFFDVKRQIPVYVPDEAVSAYENDTYWQEFDIQGQSETPQGLENVQSDNVQSTKFLRDGQIFILRGEKVYTLQGQEVK